MSAPVDDLPPAPPHDARALWLVCEDGNEYRDRFARFLSAEFRYEWAGDAAALVAAVRLGEAVGVILDLDFRRTPPERLVDEAGQTHAQLDAATRARLSATQGILILRVLRAAGFRLPVLLCADLDDPDQVAFLTQTLAPLAVVPSHESLTETAARMRRVGAGGGTGSGGA